MPVRIRSQRVEAIVLRHTNWGEADRLISLFTRESGKVRAVAKGARKPRSRKAGHLEPFTRVSLLLAQGRDLPIITQAEALDTGLNLHTDLVRLGLAAYVIELLDRFTYEEGENAPLYRLLAETLQRIDTLADPAPVVRYYEVRLLDLVGFRPQLFVCALCGKDIQSEDQFFSAERGGAVCPHCGQGMTGARPISQPGLRLLRHFQRSSYAEAMRLPVGAAVSNEVELLMQHYFTYLLEKHLNTPAFLRRIRQNVQNQ